MEHEESKKGMKDKFFEILRRESEKVMEKLLTAKAITYCLIVFIVLSVAMSVYVAVDKKCDKPELQVEAVLMSRLLCPSKS